MELLSSPSASFFYFQGSTIIYIVKLMFNFIFWGQDHQPLHAVCGQKVF